MTSEASPITSEQSSLLSFAAKTDIGKRREENQDSLGIFQTENAHFFVVADGMGGVRGGAIASQLAIETFKSRMLEANSLAPDTLCTAVAQANAQIFEHGLQDPSLSGMGTTFVSLVFFGSGMFLINVGDSRAYRIRDGNISQLSQDHTLVMELLRSGTITPEQVHNHPVSHMLTRSLGPAESVDIDCSLSMDGPLRKDKYVLCSDGLYNLVKDDEMLALFSEKSIDAAVESLIQLANQRGGTDNITVIAVEVGVEYPEVSLEQREELARSFAELNGMNVEDVEEGADKKPRPSGYYSADGNRPDHSVGYDENQDIYIEESTNGAPKEEAHEAKTSAAQPDPSKIEERISFESLRDKHVEPDPELESPGAGPRPQNFQAEIPVEENPPPAPPRATGVLARILFVVPFILGASLGGIAVAALLYSPDRNKETLAKVVERSGSEEKEPEPKTTTSGSGQETKPIENTTITLPIEPKSFGNESVTIERRKAALQERIHVLNEKLAAFDGPLSGRLGEELKTSSQQIEEHERRLDGIRSEIDVATRKLAVWYGRRKRLETTQPVDMASEVAVSSDAVREKKQLFESTTWEYLKQSEHLRYNPSDQDLAQKVAELLRLRKQHMEELGSEVRAAIGTAIAESDQHITELTVERDHVQMNIQNIQSDVDLVRIISGSDSKAREEKRAQLAREKQLAEAELAELSPAPLPSANP